MAIRADGRPIDSVGAARRSVSSQPCLMLGVHKPFRNDTLTKALANTAMYRDQRHSHMSVQILDEVERT